MREVLFRAYAKDIKEIKEVVFINLERKFATLNMGYADIDKKHEWTSMYKFEDIELMQYTGLTDKNGTKIFEGDIVQYQIDMINLLTHEMYIDLATSKIEFYNGSFTIYENGYGNTLLSEKHKDIEVIGNIHEKGK